MARPLSLDLRERIVAAVEGGLSRRSAASRFAVTENCAIKLVRRWQHTGSVEPGRWAVTSPSPWPGMRSGARPGSGPVGPDAQRDAPCR